MRERISVIWLSAAESDFVALPIKFEQLKVSFALQKIRSHETARYSVEVGASAYSNMANFN
jgi:hypothetical protein